MYRESDNYGTTKRQIELLQMLKDTDRFLKLNNIKYSLSGGSLLGAIRHNGFIPWDDDIDIMMDRANYEKFIDVVNEFSEYSCKRRLWVYRVYKANDERPCSERPTIDVFVMENCPNNVFDKEIKVLMIKILQGMMHENLALKNFSFLNKICLIVTFVIGKFFTDDSKFYFYDKISKKDKNKKCDYISGYNDLFKNLRIEYSSNLMLGFEEHTFEDIKVPIISKYDEYLKKQYGDYMKLPAPEYRVPEHMQADI